jgi:hypothetical protein
VPARRFNEKGSEEKALAAVLKNYRARIPYGSPGETFGKIRRKGVVGTIREVGKKRGLG